MNKYYANSVFCPKCRNMVDENDFIYECSNGVDGEPKHNEFYKKFLSKVGKSQEEIDTLNSENFVFRRPQMRLFKANPNYALCPVCKNKSTDILCPDCSSYLTSSAYHTEVEVISVVGIKGCGKSVYLSSLVDCVKEYLRLKGFNATAVRESVENYKLRPGQKLPGGTPAGKVNPIQIHIGNKDNKGKYPLDLLIYDIAGEDLKKTGKEATDLFKHLAMSSLIIYLFDSLSKQYHIGKNSWLDRKEIDEHSNRCMQGISANLDNETIVNEINEQVRRIHRTDLNKRNNKKLPIFLAGCISSTDFLMWVDDERIMETYSPAIEKEVKYTENGEVKYRYDYYECYKEIYLLDERSSVAATSNGAVRERLKQWKETACISQFENNFEEVAYFGVSALGKAPNAAGDDFICPDEYSPINVVNPVAWFFEKTKLLERLKK